MLFLNYVIIVCEGGVSMKAYRGTIDQFQELWNYTGSNIYQYFLKGLKENVIEFWTVEVEHKLIGELYIFWDSIDKDEANGLNRAYLCAFRIKETFQGQGIGSHLMNTVIKRVKEVGYTEITIGIDNSEYKKLKGMYSKFGFTELLKVTSVDNHYIDKNGNPTEYDEEYQIYINRFEGDKDVRYKS